MTTLLSFTNSNPFFDSSFYFDALSVQNTHALTIQPFHSSSTFPNTFVCFCFVCVCVCVCVWVYQPFNAAHSNIHTSKGIVNIAQLGERKTEDHPHPCTPSAILSDIYEGIYDCSIINLEAGCSIHPVDTYTKCNTNLMHPYKDTHTHLHPCVCLCVWSCIPFTHPYSLLLYNTTHQHSHNIYKPQTTTNTYTHIHTHTHAKTYSTHQTHSKHIHTLYSQTTTTTRTLKLISLHTLLPKQTHILKYTQTTIG